MYDPLNLETHRDPYPVYRALREGSPLYWNSAREFWALSRYEDVFAASLDWRTFTASPERGRSEHERFFGIRPPTYVAGDSSRHKVLREILRNDFSTDRIAALETPIRAIATELVERIARGRSADFVEALAQPLPARILCQLIGFPPEDAPLITRWNRLLWSREPDSMVLPASVDESEIREHIEVRASRSPVGVMRSLRAAEREGLISHEELVDAGVLLVAAGVKTTSALIAISLQLLAEHPEQQDLVATNRGLLPKAIDEVLRFDSPSQWFARVTTTDVETKHGAIPKGQLVLMLFGSANRDERRYDEPDCFDVTRPPRRHLSFGNGIHHCIAAPLARLEAQICLDVVLARLTDVELDGEPTRTYSPAERDLASLPLKFATRC